MSRMPDRLVGVRLRLIAPVLCLIPLAAAGCGGSSGASSVSSTSLQACLEHKGYDVLAGFQAYQQMLSPSFTYFNVFKALAGYPNPKTSGYKTAVLATSSAGGKGSALVALYNNNSEAAKYRGAAQAVANNETTPVQVESKANLAWFAPRNAAATNQDVSACA